ncbi:MAG: hypothetical protein AUI14_14585 [Actinobacteria bacterium 13_2_20CM_2_71_6]|nr:MAG: hypothetical protein AUI14_14585 [Actinobacteria bacterium 13_2_20CM_2_71_6]
MAAALAVPGGVLAGPSAARVHGIPVDDSRPWIAVPAAMRPRDAGVHILRERVSPYDIQLIGDVLVTSRPRAVFDCLRVLPEPRALDLLDRALQQRWITLDDLTGRVRAFTGRHGIARLVAFVAWAGAGTRSVAERLAVGLLRDNNIAGWSANAPIHDVDGELIGIGDLVFEAERIVIELDGRAFHASSDRFERDRYRQNRLIAAGWTVLRFTWRDLTRRPAYVIATIRQLLEDRSSGTGSRSPAKDFVPR